MELHPQVWKGGCFCLIPRSSLLQTIGLVLTVVPIPIFTASHLPVPAILWLKLQMAILAISEQKLDPLILLIGLKPRAIGPTRPTFDKTENPHSPSFDSPNLAANHLEHVMIMYLFWICLKTRHLMAPLNPRINHHVPHEIAKIRVFFNPVSNKNSIMVFLHWVVKSQESLKKNTYV